MNYSIRTASPNDAEAVCCVLRRSISECCTPDHCNNAELLERWLRNKTSENVRQWLKDENRFSVVALKEADVVGVAMASSDGEVLLCYALPDVRFTGVGKLLLAATEANASKLGIAALRLDSTKSAASFYARNGFVVSGDEKSVWGISAIPMTKQLARHNV